MYIDLYKHDSQSRGIFCALIVITLRQRTLEPLPVSFIVQAVSFVFVIVNFKETW